MCFGMEDDQVEDIDVDYSEEEDEEPKPSSRKHKAKEHKNQLERLKEKDPEFFEFLQENDKELLAFDDDEFEEDESTAGIDDEESEEKENKPSTLVITTSNVDLWCKSVLEEGKIGALRNIMKAYRIACHYGDEDDESSKKYQIMSSNVFNKIMVFVLSEMDGILRKMLTLPSSGGQKQTITDLQTTRKWKNYSHFVKSYLGNSLHVLNQMTNTEMIAFTLRRLKSTSLLLCAFPSLLRKYIKVGLHFWGTGTGSLPIVAFLFLRDLCIRLGTDHFEECFKGMYKAYVLNSQFVNASKLQHITLLGNCVTELIRVDVSKGYYHAFIFIRQLATILRDAITMKTKEAFRKVYEWKFISCLELWTGAVSALCAESEFKLLAYPLTQVILGTARLVPTARYYPLRIRCVKMLNRIAAASDTYIPVSMLLLDMLEMKELNKAPTKGLGNPLDIRAILKVPKPMVKTRAFQEACLSSVIEELAVHFSQWSYSVAFFEFSFVPGVRLRNFMKATKMDRFRKETRELIRQIEANSKFVNERRMRIKFRPNDAAREAFMEAEKQGGCSPISQYVAALQVKAQQRSDVLTESNVIIGEHSSVFGKKIEDEDDDGDVENGATVFSSDWVPDGKSKVKLVGEKAKNKSKKRKMAADDEDVVEDLVLSSDEDEDDLPDIEGNSNRNVSENGNSIPVASGGRSKQKSKHRGKRQKTKPSTG